MSFVIGGLFFWSDLTASGISLMSGTVNTSIAAGGAGLTLLVSLIFYFWAPKKYLFETAFASFVLVSILAAFLVYTTGETQSPFLALWMILAVFSGVFGIYGVGMFIVLLAIYSVALYTQAVFTAPAMSVIFIAGLIPLGISYLIWHTDKQSPSGGDDAYRRLASQLSQVAGKSDVVINAITDGVIATDSKGVIELINPAAQSIIGWGKQDAVKLDYKSVLKLIDSKGEELVELSDPVAHVLATNKPERTDRLTLVTNSGKKLLVSLVISPAGQIGSGVIIVFRDITREKADERQQAEFISTASHEMRTPVAAIEGYLGLVLNPNTAQIDDRARDFIQKAHESAQHLGHLFTDLLDVSRADDGRLQNEPKVINVVEFLYDIVEGLRPKANEKQLSLIYKPHPDGGNSPRFGERADRTISPIYYVSVDPDHLREVAANLVENAIKYTPKGTVAINVGSGEGESVQISVEDSGIGIPPEDIGHLFQKFYRVDNSETREIGGTGLGLYLCRRLCEAMNGRIWVESEYKHGSTFFVALPRLSTDEATRLIEQSANKISESHPMIESVHASPVTPAILNPSAPIATPVPPVAPAPTPMPAPTPPVATPIQMAPVPATAPIAPLPPQEPVPGPTMPAPPVTTLQPPAARRINTNRPQTPIVATQSTAQYPRQTSSPTPYITPQETLPTQKP